MLVSLLYLKRAYTIYIYIYIYMYVIRVHCWDLLGIVGVQFSKDLVMNETPVRKYTYSILSYPTK